jgi:hypothetical protein
MALVMREGGCKVGWHFYDNYDEAVEASRKARNLGDEKEARGYDFGYSVIGSITEIESAEHGILYRVTVP